MNFFDLGFFLVILAFLPLYWLTAKWMRLNNLLLVFGYLLYGWGHPAWVLLLFLSTLMDFLLITLFQKGSRWKMLIFITGVGFNLGIWLFFKFSLISRISNAEIAFPIGISFYMLRKLAYWFDTWRGRELPPLDFTEYALYVAFFPQLLSGPIDRPGFLIPQFSRKREIQREFAKRTAPLFINGLVKKIVIADNLALVVDRIFRLAQPSRLLFLAGSLGFAVQLFADFSAYTDFSRGTAYLLGFETSENFNSPFLALTPADFWSRWHITFSSWLREYFFMPLRRLCLKLFRHRRILAVMAPALLTMVASGFWHGLGWSFLIWGIYHGLLLGIYQLFGWEKLRNSDHPIARTVGWFFMFSLIVFGWGIFRSPDLTWLSSVLMKNIWGVTGMQWVAFLSILLSVLFYSLPLIIKAGIDHTAVGRGYLKPVYYAVILVILVIFIGSGVQEFVYSRF